MLWESFWNKHTNTSESGVMEMSPVEGNQDNSWWARILGLVCILIYTLKAHARVGKPVRIYRNLSGSQQAVKGIGQWLQLFVQAILF